MTRLLKCLLTMNMFQVNIGFPQHFYRTATPNHMDPNALVRQVAESLRSWSAEKNQQDEKFLTLKKNFENLEQSLVIIFNVQILLVLLKF